MEFKAQIDEMEIQKSLDALLEKRTQQSMKDAVEGWNVRQIIEEKVKTAISDSLDEKVAAALAREGGALEDRVEKTLDSIIKSKVKKATK